jgi:HD-like signal output (HDOD) protein
MTIDYNLLINQIQRELPTLPNVVNELTKILDNPNSSGFCVEDVMASDQSMTMKILRVANTSFYRGNRERVTSVNEAVGSLGFESIKNIVLNSSVFKIFDNGIESQDFDLSDLWQHSMGVGWASRNIARILGKTWDEEAYSCGLLHDIGKVARYKLDEANDMDCMVKDARMALDKNLNFFQAELINQSPRHDYLGYLICKNWGLSSLVESVIRWHHEPNPEARQKVPSKDFNDMIDVVILANWIVVSLDFGFSGHKSPTKPPESLFLRLGIKPCLLREIVNKTFTELVAAKESMHAMEFNSRKWDNKETKLASVHSIIEGDEGFGSNKFVQESSEKKLAEYTQSLGDEGNEFKSITDSELRNSWIGMLTSIAGEIDDGSFSVPLSNSREEALLQDVRNNRKKK